MTPSDLGQLITDLQSFGLRTEMAIEARRGGAGPADTGLVWIEGVPVTVPVSAGYVNQSPYVLRHEDDGWGVYRDGARVAAATLASRPRYYDLTTADGIPYWKIALLHLDSLASTVIQKCVYWGNEDQCAFCAIELSLEAGRTVAVKRPEHLAEVALAARDLDGAADVTLTTGSTRGPDRGAAYLARCARAIKEATGLPIEVQFEPPLDLSVMERLRRLGRRLGRHPYRIVRPRRPGPGRSRQGAHWVRWLRPGLAAGCRGLRSRPGLHLRHPGHGRGP